MKKFAKFLNSVHLVAAYANTNSASKLYVCSIAQNADLDQSGYEALTWTEIKAIGNRGEMGKNQNILDYPTWDTTVIQKAKGMTDAGTVELEVARLPTDPGQIILRAASVVGNNSNYAFKEVRADGAVGATGTVIYNRGLVVGPRRPGGRNEDFDVEIFTLAFQQGEIVVNPTAAGVAPYYTAVPTISGTPTVGQVLTGANGTWAGDATITYTYQWYRNSVAIAGANAGTYTLVTADLGTRITLRVTATNGAGTASATTAPTSAVS